MSNEITKSVLKKANEKLNNINAAKPILDDVGVSAFFVLKKLITEAYNFYDEKKDGWFYLAIKHIVDATGYCDKTIRNNIKKLEQKGYIQVDYNNGNISYYKIIKLSAVTCYRATPTDVTAPSHTASFNINNTYLTINKRFSPQGGSNEKTKTQNLNTKQPNKEKLPNLGHTGAFAPNGGKNMRHTKAGYTRNDLRANSGEAATGKISHAPAQGLGLTDKYTREEIRFAKRWFIYASDKWLTVRRKGWEKCSVLWLKCISKVTRGKDALCTFERLVELLEWAKTDSFYSKNIRDLSRLDKKWEKGNYFMLDKLSDDYDEAHKQTSQKQEKPFDIHNELTSLVRHTLAEKYDVREEYFDDMSKRFENELVSILDTLEYYNNQQSPENKQNWLYGPLCADKFKEVVQLWNEYGNGMMPDFSRYGNWERFWQKVAKWQKNELSKGKPGPWVIDNLKNYMGK